MIPVGKITAAGIELAFSLAGELVLCCDYAKMLSDATTGLWVGGMSTRCPMYGLFGSYRQGDIDGSTVKLGDAKCFVRAGDLVSMLSPGPGDQVIERLGQEQFGRMWDVVAAKLDPTGTFWLFQLRPSRAEDWGIVFGQTVDEDWGYVSVAANTFEDWGV